jgi:hypothetical protein
MHWADASTGDLLAYIGTKLESMRLLVIGAYRPGDLLLAKHPLVQVKLELQGRGLGREIAVEFLTLEALGKYLALEFPEHGFPPDLPDLLHSRTEGNALFMAQRALGNAEKLNGAARHAGVAAAAMVLGDVRTTVTQLDEAIADFAVAECAARDGGDQETRILAMVDQANVLVILKRLEQAGQLLSRAMDVARQAGSDVGIALVEARLGGIRMVQGNLAETDRHYQRAIPPAPMSTWRRLRRSSTATYGTAGSTTSGSKRSEQATGSAVAM